MVASALLGTGPVQIIQCAEARVAVLIGHDRWLESLGYLTGERHLAVPNDSLTAFRRGLCKRGYVLPKRALAIETAEEWGWGG